MIAWIEAKKSWIEAIEERKNMRSEIFTVSQDQKLDGRVPHVFFCFMQTYTFWEIARTLPCIYLEGGVVSWIMNLQGFKTKKHQDAIW